MMKRKVENGKWKVFHLLLALLLTLGALPVKAQSVGDFQMDETHLYAMTKQMVQFIRRFNYEEDQFGNKLNPKDPSYRNRQKRQQSLAILFDQQTYGSQPDLQRFFIEDITVYVKRKETQIGGRTIGFWDVLLGDMRVKETVNK